MEVMAIKASSEFGRLQSVTASGRKLGVGVGVKEIANRPMYIPFSFPVCFLPDGFVLIFDYMGCSDFPWMTSYRSEILSVCKGFDLEFSTCHSIITMARSPENYDIALYAKLALHCYNFQESTNFNYERWEKYSTKYTSELHYYITFEAMDPACKVSSLQTLFSDARHTTAGTYVIDTWRTLACRPRCNEPLEDDWDVDKAIDKFYKSAMPKWLSDEALASDNNTCYVVQDSELHENDWLHLFMEIAFFSKANRRLVASPPLEITKVVVQTKEEYITEAREKLKAENAIFYISYKYKGVSSMGFAGDHKAIVRKTMDGKPGHMTLEISYERG